MTSTAEKTRETRLRRMADRQGFAFKKSRRRDERALDYGEIWLTRYFVIDDAGKVEAVADPEGSHDAQIGPFGDLDEVEAYLTGDDA